MKLSFDEEHRHAMNELGETPFIKPTVCSWSGGLRCYLPVLTFVLFHPAGGLQAVAELLQVDCEMFGLSSDHYSVTLRRYAGMALTNLTFGDVANKVRDH